MVNNYIENEITNSEKNSISFIKGFLNKIFGEKQDENEKSIGGCKGLNKKRSAYTTGIVSRNISFNAIRVTFLNTSQSIQNLELGVYDWRNNSPECFYYDRLYLNQYSGKVIDILLDENSYDDILDVELFEVRVYPNNESVKVNIFPVNLENN